MVRNLNAKHWLLAVITIASASSIVTQLAMKDSLAGESRKHETLPEPKLAKSLIKNICSHHIISNLSKQGDDQIDRSLAIYSKEVEGFAISPSDIYCKSIVVAEKHISNGTKTTDESVYYYRLTKPRGLELEFLTELELKSAYDSYNSNVLNIES